MALLPSRNHAQVFRENRYPQRHVRHIRSQDVGPLRSSFVIYPDTRSRARAREPINGDPRQDLKKECKAMEQARPNVAQTIVVSPRVAISPVDELFIYPPEEARRRISEGVGESLRLCGLLSEVSSTALSEPRRSL